MAEGRNILDTVVGVASLAGLLAGGIWYATGLQNQLDSAQREITDLRAKLESVSLANATKGPKAIEATLVPRVLGANGGRKGSGVNRGRPGRPARAAAAFPPTGSSRWW